MSLWDLGTRTHEPTPGHISGAPYSGAKRAALCGGGAAAEVSMMAVSMAISPQMPKRKKGLRWV